MARPSLAPEKAPTRDSRGASIGGRRSSVAPSRGGVRADPRSITDKAFKERSVRKVLDYLAEHGDVRAFTPQMLQAPTVNNFVHIISFLLKAAVPNFEFANRFEDEVPAVLKLLGYPYNIQRGALQSVGAPHAWPPILASLSWLVDLLLYSEAAASSEAEAENGFDDAAGEKMFFEYLAEGYALFLRGEDDLSPLEERIAFTFEAKNSSLRSDIQGLTQANEELGKEHRSLTEGMTPLQEAQRNNDDLVSDQGKFEKHIADLHEHRKKVTARLEQEQAEAAERAAELAALVKEVAAHKETIAAQELTPADVQQMYSKKELLESELAQLGKQRDTLNKQLWDEELETSRAINRLEGKVQQANNGSLRLHLVPSDAKHARGVSHEIALDKAALTDDPSSVGALNPSGQLLPALQRVKTAVAAEVATAQDLLLESEEAATRREETAQERMEQLSSLKAQLAKLEREEKATRDEHAAELAERKAETEALEEQIRKAKSVNGQEVAASSAELAALQKEYDEFRTAATAGRERMYNQLVSSIDMLVLHKDNIEHQLLGLKKHCAAKMDTLSQTLQKEAVDIA